MHVTVMDLITKERIRESEMLSVIFDGRISTTSQSTPLLWLLPIAEQLYNYFDASDERWILGKQVLPKRVLVKNRLFCVKEPYKNLVFQLFDFFM